MKKTIGLVFVLILIGMMLAAIPFISGWFFERQYLKLIDVGNSLGKVQIEVKSYERGWYSSLVDLTVHVNTEKNSQVDFNVHQSIQHGPLLFLRQSVFPVRVGLALIHNSFIFEPNVKNILLKIGVEQLRLGKNEVFISYIPGYFSINLSEIEWKDMSGRTYLLEHVHGSGSNFIRNNKLSLDRDLTIQRLKLDDAILGPLHLDFSINQLDFQVLSEILAAYQKMLQQGEQYQGQFRGRLSNLLPRLFNGGTSASINSFSVVTSEGELNLSGKVAWLHDNPPDSLQELFQQAPFAFYLRIPKPMMDQLLILASNSPYTQEYSKEERRQLLELQDSINSIYRMNTMLVSELTYMKVIPEAAGAQLLIFQKDSEYADRYFSGIKSLFLQKKITRDVSYLMYFQFSQLQHEIQLLKDLLKQNKEDSKKKLLSRFEDWVKSGSISVDGNDYVVNVERKDGQVVFK